MEQERKRSAHLERLEALVGEWEVEVDLGTQRLSMGRAAFEWIEGGAFMQQRVEGEPPADAPEGWAENSPLPVTTIIGADDWSGLFSYLYADGRGVSRAYEMSLADGVWEIRGRPGAEFFQRFHGSFSADGRSIAARWEKSADGSDWELDFELTYTKVE